ncbi:DUF262 domain-containing protein [Aliivibrio fischeri]|uniref:GmrSD restriction endonuclease domain-containing protein n=1 Tax=Aliivibrio fischeri TaxID=668 RepID=UPI0007C4493C|nr:DUF262 domain-containing protein [Aliivibrio fischeri]
MDLVGAKLKNFYDFTSRNEGDNKFRPEEVQVKVPHYQRPYEWTKDNVSLLINDALNNTKGKYFSGASVSSIHNEACHELVDGQQRYTTLFLINYSVFLISRVALREALSSGAFVSAKYLAEKLRESMKYVFILNKDRNDTDKEAHDLEKEIRSMMDSGEPDYEKIKILNERKHELMNTNCNSNELSYLSYFENKYQELIKYIDKQGNSRISIDHESFDDVLNSFFSLSLITSKNQQDVDYINDNRNLLEYFYSKSKFRMTYSRRKYIDLIKESLLSFDFTLSSQENLKLVHTYNGKEKSNYLSAIETIFTEVSDSVNESIPLENATQIINKMTAILESVDVCVVQTGNQSDATVLFDVLNDRSKELSQLSLIKNEFYKKIVVYNEKNHVLNDEQIDEHIDKVDELWVDKIFNASPKEASLVSYLGASFLSGNHNFKVNDKETRGAISNYLKLEPTYRVDDLIFDVSVFHAIKTIIKKIGIKFSGQKDISLTSEAEYKSIFERTVKLLIAKDQAGILSGLINYTLTYILNKQKSKDRFDIKFVSEQLDDILDLNSQEINEQSLEVWISSLSSYDYLKPRDLSKRLITSFNKKSAMNINCIITPLHRKSCSKDLEEWLNEWKYKSSNQFDVKVLLINLMNREPGCGISLIAPRPQFSTGFINSSSCHLDHFEPKKLPSLDSKLYFQSDSRDDLVNSLGNMMLLTQVDNQRKSDSPAIEADKYYSNTAISNNWLYQELKTCYEQFSDNNVPTEKFFTERKKQLINHILNLLH